MLIHTPLEENQRILHITNKMNVANKISMKTCMEFGMNKNSLSLGWMSQKAIAVFYSSSITSLDERDKLFCRLAGSLYSHKNCLNDTISPHSHQHLFLSLFFKGILGSMQWYIFVVLIFLFLVVTDAKYLQQNVCSCLLSIFQWWIFRVICLL